MIHFQLQLHLCLRTKLTKKKFMAFWTVIISWKRFLVLYYLEDLCGLPVEVEGWFSSFTRKSKDMSMATSSGDKSGGFW
jgi:hypothetical protein